MKSYLIAALCGVASLSSITANAGAPAYFIPAEPEVVAPAAGDTNVNLTPSLQSANYQHDAENSTLTTSNISSSEWMVYEDATDVELIGGEKYSDGDSRVITLDLPFSMSISGEQVDYIKILSLNPSIKLYSAGDVLLASLNVSLPDSQFQQNRNFILKKENSNSLILQWFLESENSVQTPWATTIEAVITEEGIFGFRLAQASLGDALFISSNGTMECAGAGFTTGNGALSDWVTDTIATNDGILSLACKTEIDPTTSDYGLFTSDFVGEIISDLLPEIEVFSSLNNSYSLIDSEALNIATEYNVQVQHNGVSGQLSSASGWSAPVTFTTRDANASFTVAAPSDLTFTKGVTKTLEFTVTNTGSETGAAQAVVVLPYAAVNVINGNLKDFFAVELSGDDCGMNQSGSSTTFTCQLDELAAGAKAKLTAKITVADTSINKVQYKVCQPSKCDATALTDLTISVSEGAASSSSSGGSSSGSSSSSSSSSSSGGGSTFWLLLFAPLLLLRRR